MSFHIPTRIIAYVKSNTFLNYHFNEIKNTLDGNQSSTNKKMAKVIIDYSRYDEETNDYFKEIALREEFRDVIHDSPHRWTKDMKIYCIGFCPDYLTEELNEIIKELNDIIDPINIEVVKQQSQANFIIYLGSMDDYIKLYPSINRDILLHNWGYFEASTTHGSMYVDMIRTTDNQEAQKHLLREELTQSLGLSNDSYDYPESMFYQGWTTTTEFAEIDKRLIDMLYN